MGKLGIPDSPLVRSVLAGALGLVAYGGWAVFANYDHGIAVALRSGAVQGSYSFALTLTMTLLTEWLHGTLSSPRWRAPMTIAVVCALMLSTAYGIHAVAGTPEIWMTILPGFAIGCVYTTVYVAGLGRERNTA